MSRPFRILLAGMGVIVLLIFLVADRPDETDRPTVTVSPTQPESHTIYQADAECGRDLTCVWIDTNISSIDPATARGIAQKMHREHRGGNGTTRVFVYGVREPAPGLHFQHCMDVTGTGTISNCDFGRE